MVSSAAPLLSRQPPSAWSRCLRAFRVRTVAVLWHDVGMSENKNTAHRPAAPSPPPVAASMNAGGGDGVAVELLWVARLQAFSCMWLAEMSVRFPGDDGGSRVAGALLERAKERGERGGRPAWRALVDEAERWALTFRVAAATCGQWAVPPMSCIMDA